MTQPTLDMVLNTVPASHKDSVLPAPKPETDDESGTPVPADSTLYYIVLKKIAAKSTVTPEEQAAYERYREVKRLKGVERSEINRLNAKKARERMKIKKRDDPVLRVHLHSKQVYATIERRVKRGSLTRLQADLLHSLNLARRERAILLNEEN